jgi:four helix bundle protein
MQDFKKLRVWMESHRLSLEVHRACEPRALVRHPGRRTQTLRCVDSIPANIAEGSAKSGPEFARFLEIALGSVKELENHLLFTRDAGVLKPQVFQELETRLGYVRRMLIKLIRTIRAAGD